MMFLRDYGLIFVFMVASSTVIEAAREHGQEVNSQPVVYKYHHSDGTKSSTKDAFTSVQPSSPSKNHHGGGEIEMLPIPANKSQKGKPDKFSTPRSTIPGRSYRDVDRPFKRKGMRTIWE